MDCVHKMMTCHSLYHTGSYREVGPCLWSLKNNYLVFIEGDS